MQPPLVFPRGSDLIIFQKQPPESGVDPPLAKISQPVQPPFTLPKGSDFIALHKKASKGTPFAKISEPAQPPLLLPKGSDLFQKLPPVNPLLAISKPVQPPLTLPKRSDIRALQNKILPGKGTISFATIAQPPQPPFTLPKKSDFIAIQKKVSEGRTNPGFAKISKAPQPPFTLPRGSDFIALGKKAASAGRINISSGKISKAPQPPFILPKESDFIALQKQASTTIANAWAKRNSQTKAMLDKSDLAVRDSTPKKAADPLPDSIYKPSNRWLFKSYKRLKKDDKSYDSSESILAWQNEHPSAEEWDFSFGLWNMGAVPALEALVAEVKRAKLQHSESETNILGDPPKREYPYLLPQRLSLRDRQKRGIGYKQGYWSVDGLFGPDSVGGRFLPLLDVRVHRFDSGKFAANAGFIGRFVPKTKCVITGFNLYYDWREGCLKDHNQLGAGFELLGTQWDFRLNGYYPFGERNDIVKCSYEYVGGYKATLERSERIFAGGNMEVGVMAVRLPNFFFYAAVGPYYLNSKVESAWGGKVRIRPQWRDMVALDISVSQDHIFKTIFQMELMLSVPLYSIYPRKNPRHPCISDRQTYQPVERFEIIPIKCHTGEWHTNYLITR